MLTGMLVDRLILGDTLNFATSVAGYSAADGWTLKYALVPIASGTPITITSAADGEAHRVQIGASTTTNWTAGAYTWHSWVEKAGEKYSVDSGSITLAADPRTLAGAADLRSDAEQALAAAKLAFRSWTPTTRRYQIGGRSMEFNDAAEILAVISYWEHEVERERNAARMAKGLAGKRKLYVRLARA